MKDKKDKPKPIPPYSEEAEKCVLGSILLDADRVLDLCVEAGLTPDSFRFSAHGRIYRACTEMWRDGRPIDGMTIGEKLRLQRPDEVAVQLSDLEHIIDETPTTAHAEYYADVVLQKELLRRTIACAREVEQDCCTCEDAYAVVTRAEQAFLNITGDEGPTRAWSQVMRENTARIDEILAGNGTFAGLPSGFGNLDRILLGFKESEMIILAARPSMGKTALALNIAERIALGKTSDHTVHPVGVFSLEMSVDALALRMLCSHARVPSHSRAATLAPPSSGPSTPSSWPNASSPSDAAHPHSRHTC